MHTYSQILLWATAPLVLLLRMMFQEQHEVAGWMSSITYNYLPSGMKAALMLLSVFILGTSLYLECKSRVPKIVLTIVECIIVMLVCVCSIMIEYR